jgi:hypothetical protein
VLPSWVYPGSRGCLRWIPARESGRHISTQAHPPLSNGNRQYNFSANRNLQPNNAKSLCPRCPTWPGGTKDQFPLNSQLPWPFQKARPLQPVDPIQHSSILSAPRSSQKIDKRAAKCGQRSASWTLGRSSDPSIIIMAHFGEFVSVLKIIFKHQSSVFVEYNFLLYPFPPILQSPLA